MEEKGFIPKLKNWLFGSGHEADQKPSPEPIARERHVTIYEDIPSPQPNFSKPLPKKKSRKGGVHAMASKKATKKKVKGAAKKKTAKKSKRK